MIQIVLHTPWWVFLLFAVLVLFGVQALKDRTVPLWRLLVTPAVFIGWGIASLVPQAGASPLLIADWVISALIGLGLAWATGRIDQFRVERTGMVAVKASALPLLRNLVVFAAKYGLTAAAAIEPSRRAVLAPWDIAVSGFAAGYFIGSLIALVRAYSGSAA
jgi:hypothetical protein